MILKFTGTEVEQVLDGRYNSFRQAISDSAYTQALPQAITGAVEYRCTNDTLLHNSVVSPTYITSRWNTTDNKIAFPEELDHPTYVADMGFTFSPTAAAAGSITLRIYIDDTVPKLIRTSTKTYKSTTAIDGFLVTWYLGTEAGYDAKNDGIYFTLEFSADGNLYEKTCKIYRA